MAAAVIEFQHVTKVYKRLFSEEKLAALSDVSFETAPGQVCAFLGPNGAGKTTSISILMGFFFASSGEVRVFGYPPGDLRAKRQIGFLPENFAFHKFLTAPKLLRFHLQLAGRNPAAAGSLIPELLAKVKLQYPATQVVVLTAHGTIDSAVKAMKNGAFSASESVVDAGSASCSSRSIFSDFATRSMCSRLSFATTMPVIPFFRTELAACPMMIFASWLFVFRAFTR